MAAKHDGKKARANHWVMQQNLAKQKGGRPGYQFSEKKAPRGGAAKGGVVPARGEVSASASASANADASASADAKADAKAGADAGKAAE